MSQDKSELVEKIVAEIFAKNPRFNPEVLAQKRRELERASTEALQKQYAMLKPKAVEKEISEKVGSADGVEVHKLLNQLVDGKFQQQEASLKRQMLRLVAEGISTVKIQINDAPEVNVGIQHRQFKKLLGACLTRSIAGPTNVWLTGPAGSGKTKAAEGVAKALGLKFEFNGAIDTPYKLLGFIDAGGKVNRTAFREAYEHGGVYLFDEVDASQPAALLAFNAALANGYADFPNGRISRHPDCVIIAAANTWGTGPNSDYVGRNKLDAAFLDRFAQISWGYDNDLERVLADHNSWVDFIQAVRANLMDRGVKAVISPRASITGGALLKTGMFTVEEVIDMTVKKGMTQDNWTVLTNGINLKDIDPSDGGRFEAELKEEFKTKRLK